MEGCDLLEQFAALYVMAQQEPLVELMEKRERAVEALKNLASPKSAPKRPLVSREMYAFW